MCTGNVESHATLGVCVFRRNVLEAREFRVLGFDRPSRGKWSFARSDGDNLEGLFCGYLKFPSSHFIL